MLVRTIDPHRQPSLLALRTASGGASQTSELNQRVTDLDRKIDSLGTRLADTTDLVEASRSERLDQCSRQLYNACWNESTRAHKKIGFGVALATMFAGTAVGAYFSIKGMHGAAGIAALAGLVGCFHTVPRLYATGIKKFVLPAQMDKLVLPALKREQTQLEAALKTAQAQKSGMITSYVHSLGQAQKHDDNFLEVDEASVTIGDFTLDVR